jgi:hypothetical protein
MGNLLVGSLSKIALLAAISDATHPPLTLYFDDNSMEDLWMAITWGTESCGAGGRLATNFSSFASAGFSRTDNVRVLFRIKILCITLDIGRPRVVQEIPGAGLIHGLRAEQKVVFVMPRYFKLTKE